jgi:hypothetical protein
MASETPRAKDYSSADRDSSLDRDSPHHERDRAGHEQVGPLTVERLRKDDGRVLLLYELRPSPPQ